MTLWIGTNSPQLAVVGTSWLQEEGSSSSSSSALSASGDSTTMDVVGDVEAPTAANLSAHNNRTKARAPAAQQKTPAPPPPAQWKKYRRYEIEVDPDQDDKANEILLCSFARPHMRAFHCCWWAFFIAFFIWFAISPLLVHIRKDLNLTKRDIWNSSIAGVGSTVLMRFLLGPLCDVYGARILFMLVLCSAAIPTACTGLVRTATGLVVLRLFIGVAGGTFVMCQYWSSRFFTKQVVGTANALVGGWGNLGAGVTQLVMGSILFPLFRGMFGGDTERAWRTVCIVPATVGFISGVIVYSISDDAPKGNYSELKKHGAFPNKEVTVAGSFVSASSKFSTWLLFVQYACCFGVELTMNNASALYFRDEFGQSTEAASAIAAIFGWLNLFARGLGGFVSDYWNYKWGMKGRLWAQTLCLMAEGAMVLIFANTSSLGTAICALVFFSLFVQAAEGTSYAIVPYVDPRNMGSVCGIVGAGGNVGAVSFGLGFKHLNYLNAFTIMGWSILASSLLTALIFIPGYSHMFGGKDVLVDQETGVVLSYKISSASTTGGNSSHHSSRGISLKNNCADGNGGGDGGGGGGSGISGGGGDDQSTSSSHPSERSLVLHQRRNSSSSRDGP